MTNFKLFGYNKARARDIIKKIKAVLTQKGYDISDMVATNILSEVIDLEEGRDAPYIEIADDDQKRALTIIEHLKAALKEDIEVTTISKFVSAGDEFVAPRSL